MHSNSESSSDANQPVWVSHKEKTEECKWPPELEHSPEEPELETKEITDARLYGISADLHPMHGLDKSRQAPS